MEINWSITAYPNPVDNELNIKFDIDAAKEFWIEIIDFGASGIVFLPYILQPLAACFPYQFIMFLPRDYAWLNIL